MKKWILSERAKDEDTVGNVSFEFSLPKIKGCFCISGNICPIELPEKYYELLKVEKSKGEWADFVSNIIYDMGSNYDQRIRLMPNSKILPMAFIPPQSELKFLWQISAYSADCILVHKTVVDLILEKCIDDVFIKSIGFGYYIMKVLNRTQMPSNRLVGRKCPGCGKNRFKATDEALQVDVESLNFDGHIAIIDTTGYILISSELKEELEKLSHLNASFDEIDNYLDMTPQASQ